MNLDGLDAIIFDFDGVLVESVEVKTRAFAALYEKYGEDVVAQVVEYHLHHGGVSRFDKFRHFQTHILGQPRLSEQDVNDLVESFAALVIDQIVTAPMVTGAQAFLDHAGSRLPLFVVSGTPTVELDEILRRRNLRETFAGIWGSPNSKADNISELLQKHDVSARHCVMIGDAVADYDGAAANDVHFLGRVAENTENLFADEVITFTDFDGLPASWR